MQLKVRVKVNSIGNLSDARYFATFAEWAGFNFNPHDPNFLPLATARELIGWMSGPRIVGEFGNAPEALINQIAHELKLDTIQTDTDLAYRQLIPQISTIIRRITLSANTQAEELEAILNRAAPHTAYFLLRFTENHEIWQRHAQVDLFYLQQLCTDYNILLQLPFTPQNILPAINALQPAGIALDSGQEIKTGLRAFDDVAEIIELLETPE